MLSETRTRRYERSTQHMNIIEIDEIIFFPIIQIFFLFSDKKMRKIKTLHSNKHILKIKKKIKHSDQLK